jgi:diacylglycerol O-acyltransferase / wax synthase
MSYNGRIEYGLLADYDALPDVGMIAEGIEASLQELLQAARGKRPRAARKTKPAQPSEARSTNGGPTPILPSAHSRPKRGPAADMRAKRSRGDRPQRKRPGE